MHVVIKYNQSTWKVAFQLQSKKYIKVKMLKKKRKYLNFPHGKP